MGFVPAARLASAKPREAVRHKTWPPGRAGAEAVPPLFCYARCGLLLFLGFHGQGEVPGGFHVTGGDDPEFSVAPRLENNPRIRGPAAVMPGDDAAVPVLQHQKWL
jgi:hypothetical protein